MHCLCNCWDDIGENKAEDITNNQSAEDVRYKVHPTEQALAANLTVQAHCQQQTQNIDENRSGNRIFKGEQIRMSDSGIREQVDIVPESNEIKVAVSTIVGKAVERTRNQRQCIE